MTRHGSRSLRVLMIASEAHPFSKTGGLADVAGALPGALAALGHEVTLVTPRYRSVAAGERLGVVPIRIGPFSFDVGLMDVALGHGARALLVDCAPLFGREGIYGEQQVDYADNALRFAVLTLAALEWAGAGDAAPSVVHAHDWQAGLAPVYLRSRYASHPRLANVPSVLTVHNIAYQGVFDKQWVPLLELDWRDFTMQGFEYWDRLGFLKGGVAFSDAITTVSPAYAEEVQTPEFGHGLEGVMHAHRGRLRGILNGIDVDAWDPSADRFLPAPYSASDLQGKTRAKQALLEAFGLPTSPAALARPVVGMVTRLVDQKGLDLVAAAVPRLLELDATYVLVGSGEARYESLFRALAAEHPDRVGAYVGFDERRAHLVEGGADIFLMPSRFEPCGLNQMYSLRYGTVPVVRAVGGLKDTVRPYDPRNGQGLGFVFAPSTPAAMLDALTRALALFRRPDAWARLQARGMRRDLSWDRSAREYVTVYKGVIAGRRRSRPGAGGPAVVRPLA